MGSAHHLGLVWIPQGWFLKQHGSFLLFDEDVLKVSQYGDPFSEIAEFSLEDSEQAEW